MTAHIDGADAELQALAEHVAGVLGRPVGLDHTTWIQDSSVARL